MLNKSIKCHNHVQLFKITISSIHLSIIPTNQSNYLLINQSIAVHKVLIGVAQRTNQATSTRYLLIIINVCYCKNYLNNRTYGISCIIKTMCLICQVLGIYVQEISAWTCNTFQCMCSAFILL